MADLALQGAGQFGHNAMMNNRIAEWRQKRGLSYRALSELVGCDHKTIERLEKGERRLTVEWISRLSKALRIGPEDLLPKKPNTQEGSPEDPTEKGTQSKVKQLLFGIIDQMSDEEAQHALEIIDIAKKFGKGKSNTEVSRHYRRSRLAG